MLLPCPYPAVNVVSSPMPYRHVSSWPGAVRKGHAHAGIDIGGQRGEPVRALASGTVRQVRARLAHGKSADATPRAGGIARASSFKLRASGAGLGVELIHPPLSEGGQPLHSIYMHMETV